MSDTDAIAESVSVATESAAPESASSESQVVATPEASATPAETGSAQADSQANAGSGSLTPDTETRSANPDPYEKRYKDTQAAYTKERQRSIDLERKYQEIERRYQDQEKQQAAAKLPEWNPQHPNHANFQRVLERQRDLERWHAQAKTPEQQAAIAEIFNNEFPTDVATKIKAYRDHLSEQSRQFLVDPETAVQKYIQQMVPQIVQSHMGQAAQSYQQQEAARQEISPWFSDTANADVIKSQGEWMMQQLSAPGANWDYVKASAEARYYKSQFSGSRIAVASAEEKERLLRGNAAGVVSNSPPGQKSQDLNKIAEKRGLKWGSPQYFEFLRQNTK